MRKHKVLRCPAWATGALLSLLLTAYGQPAAVAQVFSNGDVFVAVGNSRVQWRSPDGVLIKTLEAPITNLFTTGMAFDSLGNLYVTMFDSQTVGVFDNAGNFVGTFGSGYNLNPESIVIDRLGNVYVGQADGTAQILKFDLSGNLLQQIPVVTERRGSDWIDLEDDLCTMRYTSEGQFVKRIDVCTGQQLPNLNPTALPGFVAYAHRLLFNGDTLVANSNIVVRLDDVGTVIQTYTAPDTNNFFALNIDPDGKSFWTGDLSNGNVYKFDIATGQILRQFNATGGDPTLFVGGITVKGEITASGAPRTGQCVTRNARFWLTHAFSTNSACATLIAALATNFGGVSLGFQRLPARFENADNVMDETDALQEALGLYLRSKARTGDGVAASSLCRARKKLAIELIAATANVILLGTDPADCSYVNGGTVTNFPADLLQQAREVARGFDPVACNTMTALLRKFNNNGLTNNFPNGLLECSPVATRTLRSIARDPTLADTCPAFNNTCASAEAVVFRQNNRAPFSPAKLSRSVDLTRYTDNIPSPTCGSGGADAVWRINPDVGQPGRRFTVDTFGSNFDTLLSVYTGDCTNLIEVVCSDDTTNFPQSQVTFTTDGTNTYFIVAEGKAGAVGKLKLHVTSP